MKKINPLIKVLLVIILIITLVLSVVFLVKINKKVYTVETITVVFKKNDFKVTDRENAIIDKSMESYIEAQNKKFKVDFYEFNSEKSAKKYYKELKSSLDKESGGIKGKVSTNKMGFDKFLLETSGNYVVLIKSKNTIVFINTNEKNKEAVDKIVKALKY